MLRPFTPGLLSLLLATTLSLPCTAADSGGSTSAAANQAAPSSPSAKEQGCNVECIDAHACCEESKKVIEILRSLIKAYAEGDLKTYETYLDDNCSIVDESTKKVILGKAKVIKELRDKFANHSPGSTDPLVSVTIDQPYAKVINDNCVVTFWATREIGGAHPRKEQAHITDIFIKRPDGWKKLHWSGQWQPVADKQ
jgi:hypothetical protein